MARSSKTKNSNGTSAANDAPKRGRRRQGGDDFEPSDHPGLGGDQSIIPGTESPEDPEIEESARELAKARRNYAAWGRTASVMDERVVGLMKAKGLDHYFRNGIEVSLKVTDPKEKAQVTVE